MNIRFGRVWINRAPFGCGKREFVFLVGRKWVQMMQIADGKCVRIRISEYDSFDIEVPSHLTKEGIRTRLERNLHRHTTITKQILELLQ